jgi:hypothetical protein
MNSIAILAMKGKTREQTSSKGKCKLVSSIDGAYFYKDQDLTHPGQVGARVLQE